MTKTKLGVSVGFLAAATFLASFFSGYTVLTLLVGYILIAEQDMWLKQTAVKAYALTLAFSVLSAVVGLIPNFVTFVDDLLNLFGSDFYIAIVSKIITFVNTTISLCEKVLFLLLGLQALKQKTIAIGPIDKLVNKHFS